MDQVKEFLRQCIIYRFWISVSVAALFAIIAYFLGSGPVRLKADTETKAIQSAAADVKKYSGSDVPTPAYKPIVEEKTQVLTRDVNAAWKQLYERQAPLLTWPETVQERFRKWGRKWPENVAESAVTLAIVDYVEAYPKFVSQVYTIFKPFNFETGQGIVSAPPQDALLRPAPFDPNKLPDLGKVWAAQERLWIQRTVLEVVAQVNKNATDWNSAIIKQINTLEVGNNLAQDQRSVAKGDTLSEPEKILAPGQEAEAEAGADAGAGMMGGMAAMMGGRKGEGMMAGGMMGGGAAGTDEEILYVKSENDKGQYKILPILVSVLVDQDHIQDLFVELENSPMSIQVMDFELERPQSRVTKPEKGTNMSFGGYGGMMGGMAGMMRGMGMMGGRKGEGMMAGYGGMAAMMRGMGGRMGEMGGMGAYGGMMGAGAGTTKKGVDKRGEDRQKKREEQQKAVEASKGPSLFDPYFNIVEVKVYGQARFYNPPPAEAEVEASPGATTDVEAKAETPTDADAPKADAPKAEAPKADAPKAEAPKADAPKAEAPKADAPKAEAPKADAPKAEAPKADAPKAEAPKAVEKPTAPPKGATKAATPPK